MSKRDFFISFHFFEKDAQLGFGNCYASTEAVPITRSVIEIWNELLRKEGGYEKVIILNFIELEKEQTNEQT